MLPEKYDHVERGLARLPSMWSDSPRVRGLLESFLLEFQGVEDVFFDLLEKRSISTAEGVQLDVLGDLLNEPRQGRSDAEYRAHLKALPLVYRSGGTANELMAILKEFSHGTTVRAWDHPPACVFLYTDGYVDDVVKDVITRARAAGVRWAILQDEGQNSLILSNESTVTFKVMQSRDDWDHLGLVFFEEERLLTTEAIQSFATQDAKGVSAKMLGPGANVRFITSEVGGGLYTDLVPSKNYRIEASGFSSGLKMVLQDGAVDIAEYDAVNGITRLTTVGLASPRLAIVTTEIGAKFVGTMYIKEVVQEADPDMEERGWLPDLFHPSGEALPAVITHSQAIGVYDPLGKMSFNRDIPAYAYDPTGAYVEVPVDEPRLDYDPVSHEWKGLLLEGNVTPEDADAASVTTFTPWHTQQGAWVIRVEDAVDMETLLVVDGVPLLYNVSGSGTVVINQTSWTTADIYVDGVLAYSLTPYDGVDFESISELLIAKLTAGIGWVRDFRWIDHVLTEEEIEAL